MAQALDFGTASRGIVFLQLHDSLKSAFEPESAASSAAESAFKGCSLLQSLFIPFLADYGRKSFRNARENEGPTTKSQGTEGRF
jgi:hypothetical protein